MSDVQLHWGVKIPLRDGIHLNATLYLPRNQTQPAPVIFTLLPYIGQVYHDRALDYAAHGYPFLTVDVRGRGDSAGEFKPLANDARDGHDVVEWLAKQTYCNGKVAMWGGSYMGFTQWATVSQAPQHLATIVPVASPFIGVDVPMRNNIFPSYLLQWLTLVSGRASQSNLFGDQPFWRQIFRRWFESGVPFEQLDTVAGNTMTPFREWLSHPHPDTYWDCLNPTAEQYARVEIPILTITGSYDGDQPGALTHYREHLKHSSAEARARHYLVIGPWDHAGTRVPAAKFGGLEVGPESLLDLPKLHREWYAWTMQGGPKPEFLHKPVAYYVMGAEKWRYADTLEAITARHQPLYLRSGSDTGDLFQSGLLTEELPPAQGSTDTYIYDPRDVGLAELEGTLEPSWTNQSLLYVSKNKRLFYHTRSFDEEIEISGFFRFSAWLAIDQPDTDFQVSVYEVDMDGSAVLLSADWTRARYRESFREEKLIETREPLKYDFERFTFVSRRIKRHSRLRLVIGPVNSIHSQKNYNSGGVVASESVRDARTVTVTLFSDLLHLTTLWVPIGQPDIER